MITPRPTAYHRRSDRGPQELAIRRLWSRGWHDGRIAEALCDLAPADILLIEKHGLWNYRDVEGAMKPGAGGRPWTRRQVEHHRRRLGLRGKRQRHQCSGSPVGARWAGVNARAAELGWGHLCPLTPAELSIVEDLAAHGPGTRRQIEARAKVNLDRSDLSHRTPLRRLLDRQALRIVTLQPSPVYALAEGVKRHERTPFKTRLERLAKKFGWTPKGQ